MSARAWLLTVGTLLLVAALWLLLQPTSGAPEVRSDAGSGNQVTAAEPSRGPGLTAPPAVAVGDGALQGQPGEDVPAEASVPGRLLSVRVMHDGRPVEGAHVEVRALEAPEDQGGAVTGLATADGSCLIELGELVAPLGVTARAGGGLAPAFVVLDEVPDAALKMVLESGAPLEVRTIDLQGEPVPAVDLVVYPIDPGARGEPGPVRGPTAWFLEDGRHVTTDSSGAARVEGLDAGRLYRAYARGWGTPMQVMDSESAVKPLHDAVRPGEGRILQLMVVSLRMTWLRAVDADSGATVEAATITPIRAAGRIKDDRMLLKQAYGLWYERAALMGLAEPVGQADYFRDYVVRGEAPSDVACGAVRVEAPGYEARELAVWARPLAQAAAGPTTIPLRRSPGTSLTDVSLRLRSSRPDIRAIVKVVQGRTSLYLRGYDAAFHRDQPLRLQLLPGTYQLLVGGNEMETLDIRSDAPLVREIDLDALSTVEVELHVGGMPWRGIGSVAMFPRRSGPFVWGFSHARVPYAEGRSPPVVVLAGDLHVGGGTGDGTQSELIDVSVAPGEHAVVEVRVD
ncbi:MAG: hypothetical protein KDB73_11020 [Planctomycetes bacterium]|nr:hypothetical protein [Planctomycetota bacterium]